MIQILPPTGPGTIGRGVYRPTPSKQSGLLGIDPITWLQIAGSMAQGAQGGGWGAALQGTAGALQGRQQKQEQEGQSDAQRRALMAMQAGDMNGAIQILSQAKGMEGAALNAQMAQTQEEREQKRYDQTRQDALDKPITTSAGTVGWVKDENGKWVEAFKAPPDPTTAPGSRAFDGFIEKGTGEKLYGMADGTVKRTGIFAYTPPQITDMGGGLRASVDKVTLESTPLNTPEQLAHGASVKTSAEKQGTLQGEAAFNLPSIEERASTAINSIGDLRSRNIGSRYGLQSKVWAISGTEGADIQSLIKQVTSQAFLNAFDQLRGAGQITEMEGQAATAAITRLNDQNISVGEALKAMDELEGYYKKGIETARKKATAGPTLPQRPGQAPAGEYSVDDLLKLYGD
jgi:hypothetical protein